MLQTQVRIRSGTTSERRIPLLDLLLRLLVIVLLLLLRMMLLLLLLLVCVVGASVGVVCGGGGTLRVAVVLLLRRIAKIWMGNPDLVANASKFRLCIWSSSCVWFVLSPALVALKNERRNSTCKR
jgi:hypothetical protein